MASLCYTGSLIISFWIDYPPLLLYCFLLMFVLSEVLFLLSTLSDRSNWMFMSYISSQSSLSTDFSKKSELLKHIMGYLLRFIPVPVIFEDVMYMKFLYIFLWNLFTVYFVHSNLCCMQASLLLTDFRESEGI